LLQSATLPLSQRVVSPAPAESNLCLLSGSANIPLSREISRYLGMDLSPMTTKTFADGETYVQIQESIRGRDVYIIQPTCHPVNDHLMELMVMIDACRRASASRITAVLPYYGYARADRKTAGRESIAAKLVANLVTTAGADRVIAMDLHSAQIQGYFDIPLDHIYASPVIVDYILSKKLPDMVVVSPDVGGVARARAFAKRLNDSPLAIIDKRRQAHNVAEVMNVIGDVSGKTAILVDDMIDTGGTITEGAKMLRSQGARQVYACATHAVFSGQAVERLSSGVFEEVIVTNSLPITPAKMFAQLTPLSVANLIGEVIWRVHEYTSVSIVFR
jgi:ribose-phosphate pyrophosphokinase